MEENDIHDIGKLYFQFWKEEIDLDKMKEQFKRIKKL